MFKIWDYFSFIEIIEVSNRKNVCNRPKDKYYINLNKHKDKVGSKIFATTTSQYEVQHLACNSTKRSPKKGVTLALRNHLFLHVLRLLTYILPKKDRKACRVEVISCSVLEQHPAWFAAVKVFTEIPKNLPHSILISLFIINSFNALSEY